MGCGMKESLWLPSCACAMILTVFAGIGIVFAGSGRQDRDQVSDADYTADSLIVDVISDPVFGSFGRLLFPVDESYFSGETLGDL